MNVLIASDSFKGSLTSAEICEIAEEAITAAIPDVNLRSMPLADGGEGSVEALVINTEGTYKSCMVKGPLGKSVQAVYGILGDQKTAVIEMASASGIILLKEDELNPMLTTSYGTGELILDALNEGCHKIIMCIGGSATNDGGLGMLQALGFEFYDENHDIVGSEACDLIKIRSMSNKNVNPKVLGINIVVACDVNNPLIGANGATYIYGPQKGATKDMLSLLDKGLENFGNIIEKTYHKKVVQVPGSGAAGGMGAGLLGCLNSRLDSGFRLISDVLDLEMIVANGDFDYIFTGEGQINHQTINGKLPHGITRLGKKHNVPVIAVAGSLAKGYENLYGEGLKAAFSIINKPMSLNEAISHAEELVYHTYYSIAKTLSY